MSAKSNAHATRSKYKSSLQNVIVQEENEAPFSKDRFLSNNHNDSQLISLLSEYLTIDGQMVHIYRGDMDTKTVSTALELSKVSNVIVVANNTDVVVMLLYHCQNHQKRGKKMLEH